MSNDTLNYEMVVLGRYYIDNWIMGMIRLHNGYLIDTTKAGTFPFPLLKRSAWNPHGHRHILEKVFEKVHRVQRLYVQQAGLEKELPMGLFENCELFML